MTEVEKLQPSQGYELDRLYDIPLELERLKDFPAELQGNFLEGQVIGLLNEHAGYVPFSEIEGTLTPEGAWEIQGLDLETSWQRTIKKYGHGSREHKEVIGYQNVKKKLLDQAISTVALSSPSKEGYGDRRFTFVFRKVPNDDGTYRVIQTNIMHRHDDVAFSKAQEDMDALQLLPGFIGERIPPLETVDAMLVEPLAFQGDEDDIYRVLGLTREKVAASEAFTKKVRQDLGQRVQDFIAIMTELSKLNPIEDKEQYEVGVVYAKQERDLLFELAENIRRGDDVASQQDINAVEYYATHDAPRFYGSLVCDTQASAMYAGLLGDISPPHSPHAAAMYSVFGAQAVDREAWRDTSKWPIKDCRAFGKGGCGAKEVKIGPCAICEDCQKDYDSGGTPKTDRSNKPVSKSH